MDCWSVCIDSPSSPHTQSCNTQQAHMSDSDVIDTGAAVNDAVQSVAARMGLQQQAAPKASSSSRSRNKRTAAPVDRTGPIWDSVTVVREHDTSPQVKCNNCGHAFCGGATRIEAHIIDKCPCETDVFLAMKDGSCYTGSPRLVGLVATGGTCMSACGACSDGTKAAHRWGRGDAARRETARTRVCICARAARHTHALSQGVASVVRVTWSIVWPVNTCICISHGAPTEYTNTYCGSRSKTESGRAICR